MKKHKVRGKKVSAEELERQIKYLQRELFNAKVHFDIFMGLREAWSENIKGIQCSPAFWQFTMEAHMSIAIVRLCRIYDVHQSALHLLKFLHTVEANSDLFSEEVFRDRHKGREGLDWLAKYSRSLSSEQLEADKAFCNPNSPLVGGLLRWRDFKIAHSNYAETVNAMTEFHTRFPLPFENIKALIDRGFSIVNSYSGLLNATTFSEQFASQQERDFQFVLDALKTHLRITYPD